MQPLTLSDWESKSAQLKIEGRAFVNGAYVSAAADTVFECVSPVDGRFLANVASCDAADADHAVSRPRHI
jgi:4-guanidinobutyraldehyde dehydrogenase/NAD-dependent aldehyde dehydrogenase